VRLTRLLSGEKMERIHLLICIKMLPSTRLSLNGARKSGLRMTRENGLVLTLIGLLMIEHHEETESSRFVSIS